MLDDYGLILSQAPSPPVFAYGHSLGGLVVLTYVQSGGTGMQAAIVTAPWLRLSFPAPATKVMVARSLVRILPAMTMATGLEQAAVSRDPAVVAAYAADPLVHDRLSFRLGVDLLDGGERALDRAGDFRLPVLLMHGGADRLTDPKASQLFYERAASADKTFRLWPGAYHEIHNDLEWEQVLEVATDWARPRAA
jgi:alpha-beta hydrolase superfamily lysophospholipase